VNREAQCRELGEFLKARRRRLGRTELGLPPVGGRKSTGARREEVAYLSGVSFTWYAWLEQGRGITPSRQVLDALARTLQLSLAEHAYILSLVGYSGPRPDAESTTQTVPAHVQRLLDALVHLPAVAIAPDWAISGWNTSYAALYPNVATVPVTDRNLLWLAFTDPYMRDLMPDWELTSRRLLAQFRAEAGPRLGHPSFSSLVERLLEANEAFRAGWESHDVEGLTSRELLFRHPVVGDLHLEQHPLMLSDHSDLHVMIYTPVQATAAPARLRQMIAAANPG
jgi:transcriptional regulator with XRE-family HTH domain